MASGRVVTDHAIRPDRWYLAENRIPPSIAIESGQADLLLSAYLGADFVTKGLAVYRLLDAAVTFHRSLPGPGDVLKYDIRIERFFRQGDTHLFRFRFDGTVNGEPLLTMRDGCAGFFTEQELAAGKGIVQTELQMRPVPGKIPADWRPFAKLESVERYDEHQLGALRAGRLADCFGSEFAGLPLEDPLTLPGGMLKLVDRVVELDPRGGRFGLGRIRAEMDIAPDAWFLTCHFVDDQVMPGTLMYECCLHTLRVLLLRLGWVGEARRTTWEPVPGVASVLKCRGQVTASTKTVMYEVAVKELGYRPEPFAVADVLMYADGKPIVEISNMTLRLTGTSREELSELWGLRKANEARVSVLFTRDQVLEFAAGFPSRAFGEPYRPFDRDRFIARLPNDPYSFISRVTRVRDAQAWKLAAGGEADVEYDVRPDDWYFHSNRLPVMPYAILNEVALQACGWMSAWLGSALASSEDLHFRNLGGTATQHAPVEPHSGRLVTTVKLTKVARSAGMIIQHFDFATRCRGQMIYQGTTYFGFFTRSSLADQVGIREASLYVPTEAETARAGRFQMPDTAPFPDGRLRMLDTIERWVADGGPHGLGYCVGSKRIDPSEWFFNAHFVQDPVWPGSLGLEAFVQLLKVAAYHRWGGFGGSPEFGRTHTWIYRGQVVPANEQVVVDAIITGVDDERRVLRGEGYLSVDGRVIYQMKDFTMTG
jgi:3-hydroxymyristoyl/3-hydroxydecanoyl-(acyl carrier protein) dehydratase